MPDRGLAVTYLRLFKEALLGIRIYMNDKDGFWRRVVSSKYGDNGVGWYPAEPNGPYGQSS